MLRIIGWDDNFENAKSREIKNLTWVPMPNKQDGDGYTELLDHENGPQHFGAWCAIVQVASRCRPRGTLVRDAGLPHNPATLARMTRFPKELLAAAVKRLIFDIGWLEYVTQDGTRIELTDYSQEGAVLSHQSATIPHQGTLNGMEGKKEGTEQKELKEASPFAIAGKVIVFPTELETLEARSAILEWLAYKRSRGQGYKATGHIEKKLAEFAPAGPAAFIAAVNHCIGSNYDGLFPAKESKNGKLQIGDGQRHNPGSELKWE